MIEDSRRLFTVGPDDEPLWMRLYIRQFEERWIAMLGTDEAPPPGPGALIGLAFFGDTAEEAETLAKEYLAGCEPVN